MACTAPPGDPYCDHPNHLQNMSCFPRSWAEVKPRRIHPRTVASGARVREDVGVHIQLIVPRYSSGPSIPEYPKLIRFLVRTLQPPEIPDAQHERDDVVQWERRLRAFADTTMRHAAITGCIVVWDVTGRARERNQPSLAAHDPSLAFTMLTKTTEHLCIAAKTPNLTPELLLRSFVTFDPRIVALVQEHP